MNEISPARSAGVVDFLQRAHWEKLRYAAPCVGVQPLHDIAREVQLIVAWLEKGLKILEVK